MASVLTVEAKLNGDASGLVSAANRAATALDKLEKSGGGLKNLGGSFASLGRDIGSALSGGIRNIADFGVRVVEVTGRVVKSLAGLTLKAGLTGAVLAGAFTSVGIKAGLERLMSIQDATVSLTRMLGSAEKAAALTGEVLADLKGTPFAFPQFAEATRTLVAFGVKAEKIPKILRAVADSAAASGEGAAAVDRITQSFARMAVTGKLNSDIIESLGTAGVNALGLLGNHFGVTAAEAQGMVSDGLIPAEEAMDILVDGIENGSKGIAGDFKALGGAAKELGATISGSLGNVKAAFARMGASWLKPFEKDFPDVMNRGIIPLLDKVGAKGQEMMQKLADTGVLRKITEGFEFLTTKVGPAADAFLKIIGVLSPLAVGFKAIEPFLPRMMRDFEGIGGLVSTELIPALGALIGALMPLLPAFTELVSAGIRGFIEILPSVVDVISALVGVARPLMGIISDLPGPFLGLIAVLGTLSAMGIPVASMVSTVVSKLATMAGAAVSSAATTGTAASAAFGPWGVALAVLGTIVGAFLVHQQNIKQRVDDLTASLDVQTGALTRNTRELALQGLESKGARAAADTLGLSMLTVTDAALGNADAIKVVNDAINSGLATHDANALGMNKEEEAAWLLSGALGSTVRETEAAIAKDQERAQAMGVLRDAQAAFTSAVESATSSIATNGATLDSSTAAGQANRTALDAVGAAANATSEAVLKESGSNERAAATASIGRDSFIRLATSMGMGAAEAAALADQIIRVPNKDVKVNASVNGAAEVANLSALIAGLKDRVVNITTRSTQVDVPGVQRFGLAEGGIVTPHATGGISKGVTRAFANGNITRAANGLKRQSMIAKGGANILWAEPETGWEAYISGNDKAQNRNEDIWLEAGRRLGMFDKANGNGGGKSGPNVTVNNYGVDPSAVADAIAQRLNARL